MRRGPKPGYKQTEEHKRNAKAANVMSDNGRSKLRQNMLENNPMKNPAVAAKISGPNNWNWKGGVYKNRYRETSEWKGWRNAVFERDNFTCQNCGTRSVDIVPHHIVPIFECEFTNQIEQIYDITNGMTLCKKCHIGLHRIYSLFFSREKNRYSQLT